MSDRKFERAFSKKLSFDEDFEGGPIFQQDHDLIYDKKLEYEPLFLYHIDYDFSCDVDVWGRVATNKVEIGSVAVTCVELQVGYRVHDFSKLIKEELKAAIKFSDMVHNRIEEKYSYGIHAEDF